MVPYESNQGFSPEEEAGLNLIYETGGLFQSQFWKELGISSRKGSRIVESLLDSGVITRESAIHQGHRTYFLAPVASALDFSLLMAADMLWPFAGEAEFDPGSDVFSQWVMNLGTDQ